MRSRKDLRVFDAPRMRIEDIVVDSVELFWI